MSRDTTVDCISCLPRLPYDIPRTRGFRPDSSTRPPTLFIIRAMATASKDRKEKVGVSENFLFLGADSDY